MRFAPIAPIVLGSLVTLWACSDGRGASGDTASFTSRAVSAESLAAKTAPRAATTRRVPAPLDLALAGKILGGLRYERSSHLSAATKAAVHAKAVRSIPYFTGSYSLGGQTYPYYMAGGDPRSSGTTAIDTTLIPISLAFDEFQDANGNPLVVDVTPYVNPTTQSPNFVPFQYGTGYTQFTDAIQRAQFWNVMRPEWHTLYRTPRVQKGITLEIPVGAAQVQQAPNGVYLTVLDWNFFVSQFNTIIQLADFRYNEVAMLLTPNLFLSDGSPGYTVGFHTAYDAKNPESSADPATARFAQTIAWASWADPAVFGTAFSDVVAISHEMAELTNDPFVDNATENWAFPGSTDGTACQNNLETGDPVEVLDNPSFPVTLHGFTYHPQTEALLQWFSQETPSSAYHGAYSYPDMTALPVPAQNCATPAAADGGGGG